MKTPSASVDCLMEILMVKTNFYSWYSYYSIVFQYIFFDFLGSDWEKFEVQQFYSLRSPERIFSGPRPV